jgi:hypothetical protein
MIGERPVWQNSWIKFLEKRAILQSLRGRDNHPLPGEFHLEKSTSLVLDQDSRTRRPLPKSNRRQIDADLQARLRLRLQDVTFSTKSTYRATPKASVNIGDN